MTYGIGTLDYLATDRRRSGIRVNVKQFLPGTVALACGALVGAYILYGRTDEAPGFRVAAPAAGLPVAPAAPGLRVAAQDARPALPGLGAVGTGIRAAAQQASRQQLAQTPPAFAPSPYGTLLDPSLAAGASAIFADSAPLSTGFALRPSVLAIPPAEQVAELPPRSALPPAAPAPAQMVDAIPLPVPRPPLEPVQPEPPAPQMAEAVPVPAPRPSALRLAAPAAPPAPTPGPPPVRQVAQARRASAPATAAPADNRNFIEKLFGVAPQQPGSALAYASAETTAIPRSAMSTSSAAPDRFTAVYNIAAHTVYLPDGRRLEAHSGLGNLLDDPRHVNEKNRGATPPAVYELQPREQLFHGVQALRLNPVNSGVYGRNGLLAHTYMLGPKGASNGCVSFKDYNAFLQAYMNGQVKRLVVVAGLN